VLIRFLIAGGLYSVTALRKTGAKGTVYAKHLEEKKQFVWLPTEMPAIPPSALKMLSRTGLNFSILHAVGEYERVQNH
jgi:hypothetical protein